ncbi:MAG: FAD-dependent oxidoreductase [Bacillota bacterium]|nr:FAD-dependent oxidoreductase [Bacillota bacterium]
MTKIIIIGAGPAGVTAAETVCRFDELADIIMLSSEPYPPYSPPALVEYFLTGEPVHFWKGKDFPEKLSIEFRPGIRVKHIQTEKKTIILDSGDTLAYDRLLIAAGARLYTPLDGSDKEGIHNFKSLMAGEKLLSRVRAGEVKTALIVGAGFIGVEIALLLNELGIAVKMLVRSRIMRGMLDPETSAFIMNMLRARGIEIIEGEDADALAFTGRDRAEGVQMRSGKELQADLLVAATGLKPNIEFLEGSGIESDWGVMVDEKLCTNYPDVYAAGDIAETTDRVSGRRYAHANFPNAVAQGVVAGLNLLGHDVVYNGSDSMNSLKHLGLPVMAAGIMEGEELSVRSDGNLRKLWVKDDRLVGFRLAGDIGGAGIYLSLIRRAVPISTIKDKLTDKNFGMAYLMESALDPTINIVREY